MLTVFRPIQANDLDDLYQLALNAGIGITTLPKDKSDLELRIDRSLVSFEKKISSPRDENYFFVLEDLEQNRVVGCSAIEAAVGYKLPFYAYRISKVFNICHSLDIRSEYDVLTLNNDFQGMTEICSLYLDQQYRKHGNGLLLSKARFMFMATAMERFSNMVLAEMRGWSDKNGNSPFWDSFGKHFFKMSFPEADRLSALTDKQFISDLLPQHPVHVKLLSEEAQKVIGLAHPSTVPAMKILQQEGFCFENYIDIFDAGPAIEAPISKITTIKNINSVPIIAFSDDFQGKHTFISNTALDFRAVNSRAQLTTEGVIVSQQVASTLQVELGDQVQVIGV